MYELEFQQGYNAFFAYKPKAECPYEPDSEKYHLWVGGWEQAEDEYIEASIDIEMH